MINAAPIPMNARVAMSTSGVVANALAIDPRTKITSPADSADRRPNRSPMLPVVSSRPAKTRV